MLYIYLYLCVYICVLVFVHVSVVVHTHVCAYVYNDQGIIFCLSLSLSTLTFKTGSLRELVHRWPVLIDQRTAVFLPL